MNASAADMSLKRIAYSVMQAARMLEQLKQSMVPKGKRTMSPSALARAPERLSYRLSCQYKA